MEVHWYLAAQDGTHPWNPAGTRLTDFTYMKQLAGAIDYNGYAGALIATLPGGTDPWSLATGLAQHTQQMKFIVAQYAGVIAPLWGLPAAVAASSGYGAVGVADTVVTARSKPAAMLPAIAGSLLVSLLVALTHGHAVAEALTVLAVTFGALLWTAWGKRGMPLSFVMILSLIFQMAAFREVPMDRVAALSHLDSSTTWVTMRHELGMRGRDIADAAAWAAETVLDPIRDRG